MTRVTFLLAMLVAAGALGGCANLPGRTPIEAYLVGVEPLQGEGLELRLLVKLRVQNPNDEALDFNGVQLAMDVQGKPFATGVSDAAGSIPRYGETVISVPVSISAFRLARSAIDVLQTPAGEQIAYELRGKIAGPGFGGLRFSSKGEMVLPDSVRAHAPPSHP